jgi:L-aspartate semialdehyde sulfurtransferase ferredoxin
MSSNQVTRKCWLTFEGGKQNEPCLWKMSNKFPNVMFDIRQANVTRDIGIMAVLFAGEEKEVDAAIALLLELGVKVDPVQGGSLVAG